MGSKIAISIDEILLDEIKEYSNQLNVSRSKFFAIAAQSYMLNCVTEPWWRN